MKQQLRLKQSILRGTLPSIWELLGGSRLLHKGFGTLNKHLTPMQYATHVLSEAK